jgi:SAM-dependent methyltransferase
MVLSYPDADSPGSGLFGTCVKKMLHAGRGIELFHRHMPVIIAVQHRGPVQSVRPVPSSRPNEQFGEEYRRWKQWTVEDFGKLGRTQRRYFDLELRRVHGPLATGSPVLEIGFGHGQFLEYGREMGWKLSGTELNESLVVAASQRGVDAYCCASLERLRSEHFALVAAFDVLEHVPPREIATFLHEIHRVLVPGGGLLARVPNGDSPFGLPYQNGDPTHVNALGSGKFRSLARQVGFELDFIGGEAEPVLGVGAALTVHRLLAIPAKALLNGIANLIFFPTQSLSFCSANLTAVMRKPPSNTGR